MILLKQEFLHSRISSVLHELQVLRDHPYTVLPDCVRISHGERQPLSSLTTVFQADVCFRT
jgi:hypothetical protein